MDRRQRMIRRFRTDYDFMTIITAVWSLFVSVIFALYNGVPIMRIFSCHQVTIRKSYFGSGLMSYGGIK